MILTIACLILNVLGIYGFFIDHSTLLIIGAIGAIIKLGIGIYNKEVANIGLFGIAALVGLTFAVLTDHDILLSICFFVSCESLATGILDTYFTITAYLRTRA